jgi:hypothetical protein
MASADQNVPEHQKATFEVVKGFMEATVFMKTCLPLLSNDKYSTVEEDWKLGIQAQDHQCALAGTPVGMQSFCQLPSGPSLK